MATWWKFPCSDFWGEALSNYIPGLGHLINYKISRADCDFSIEKGYVRTSNFVAQGSNMSLEGGGWIRLSDLQVNSDFKLGLRGLPGFITSPVFLLAGGLFQVRGNGAFEQCFLEFRSVFRGESSCSPCVGFHAEEVEHGKRSMKRDALSFVKRRPFLPPGMTQESHADAAYAAGTPSEPRHSASRTGTRSW